MLDKLYQISIYLRSNRIASSIIFDNTMLMVRLGLVQKTKGREKILFWLEILLSCHKHDLPTSY